MQASRKHGLATHAKWVKFTARSEGEEVMLCFLLECMEGGDFRDFRRRLRARLKRHESCTTAGHGGKRAE